jgi:hypothetical protein
MQVKRIMVCLDGSKNSLRGLDAAISLAKQSNATLVGIHSVTKFSPFTAVHTPKIPEKKWSNEFFQRKSFLEALRILSQIRQGLQLL